MRLSEDDLLPREISALWMFVWRDEGQGVALWYAGCVLEMLCEVTVAEMLDLEDILREKP